MITAARIDAVRELGGMGWLTALRAPAIAALAAADGPLQLSLFDTQDLAEITHPDHPGERLIACRNPALAAERARTREDLLRAIEKLLAPIIARVAADTHRRRHHRRHGRQGRQQIHDGQTPHPASPPLGAQLVIAAIGLDRSRFLTPGHLVSWAKLCPRTIQSGARHRAGRTDKGNPYRTGVLGEAATAAAKTTPSSASATGASSHAGAS
jgi:transposase